ncbi:hypothetical protein B0I35DRAFT_352262 [Stachybotrys elegans]|uniref:Ras-GEF domain-containing protein n=1 Tax=Stachybotrys elegans TaxID=80388 RepID=A0A8K0WT85_9HYPO|nr:hypothetical protein B0I35DRAFT_352262 [Stachybotrys elegans]
MGVKGAKDLFSPRSAPRNNKTSLSIGKPLLPASERKLHEDRVGSRSRKGSEADKWDAPLEAGATGREGRQFTVGNVGNNGRIYLRPAIRPANQRYAQPNNTLPLTPPATAGLGAFSNTKSSRPDASDFSTNAWTTTPSTPLTSSGQYFSDVPITRKHRRAVSESTVQEPTPAKESDDGALKIVISKPLDDKRPKTMEDLDGVNAPILDIQIPNWRLGTPRFTLMGTPLIRGSSYYTPTEELESNRISGFNHSNASVDVPVSATTGPTSPRRISIPRLASTYSAHGFSSRLLPTLPMPKPMRSTYMSHCRAIEPAMFDDLTFKPACDDKSLVRYSSSTGAVTAATPPRLVAEITSPSFLDYELISDFFLTYRAFLEPIDLLRMLIARLRWAVARDDEMGMIVRVRTFVALRHWILNYFMDDFLVDYQLRVTFCSLLNEFVAELAQEIQVRKVQLKILTELKKCWRRVCSHYWDGPAFGDALPADAPVAPGGIAGHRDPDLDPSFWDQADGPPQLHSALIQRGSQLGEGSLYADIARAGRSHQSSILVLRPGTPEKQIISEVENEFGHTSPVSLASMDVISCSFPTKMLRAAPQYPGNPLAAHPVSSFATPEPQPVATTPKALAGKRVHANHKRDNSLTDTSREHVSDKVSFKDKEFLVATPFAGSLVRGNLLPPSQPFVDVAHSTDTLDLQRQTTVFQSETQAILKEKAVGGAMSAYGMRRLLANVRKALSARSPDMSGAQTTLDSVFPSGTRGATTNRLPGTAVVPQGQPRNDGARPPVRIDLLGAEVAEDFKNAIREDAIAEAESRGYPMAPAELDAANVDNVDFSSSQILPNSYDSLHRSQHKSGPSSDMGITLGSKSIVIVDGTAPLVELMTTPAGGVPPRQSAMTTTQSILTLGDSFMPHGGDPTPPNTPPAQSSRGTPRRSSYLLNQHVMSPSMHTAELPPFIPDLETLSETRSPEPGHEARRPSTSTTQSPRYTGFRRGGLQRHTRNRSTRTQQSLNSILNRRHASFGSAMQPEPSILSFEASASYYGESDEDDQSEVSMPQPLRVLRRRPGGDLRAATQAKDLERRLTRSRSVGSLTAYSESIRDSYAPVRESALDLDSPMANRQSVFSLGRLAEQPPKSKLSLFSTRSSKQIMRPSFEAEAAKLAQIPDDDDDDGGIESALRKLEGTFTKKPSRPSLRSTFNEGSGLRDSRTNTLGVPVQQFSAARGERLDHRHMHIDEELEYDEEPEEVIPQTPETIRSRLEPPQRPMTEARSFLSEATHESYSSIPLLDRGLTDDVRSRTETGQWTNRSVLQGSDEEFGPDGEENTPPVSNPDAAKYMSFNFIQQTEALEGVEMHPRTRTSTEAEEQSFLNDDSGSDTDLSTELSADAFDSDYTADGRSKQKAPMHPLGDPNLEPRKASSSQPAFDHMELRNTGGSVGSSVGSKLAHSTLPLTPVTSPPLPQSRDLDNAARGSGQLHQAAEPAVDKTRTYSVHLPFILAFDSDILAQQFTLIEKDALNEIDWKELIDLAWKNSTNNTARSWVDFLRNMDAHGVEVVIARFNIMVKWVISEIVLTQHVEERARCIIKFIHIAAHCRRYRNFATMAQLTIALTSNEIDRLGRTWALVPEHDMNTLRDLETLVTPMRNFHSLRAEMEKGSNAGCIPFVGIYTHDLLYNAQRPSEIASSPTTAPLINFERCRIGAVVVKTLLRLLEASSRYTFLPVEGITERCLWIGALSDEEIRQHSEALE